jgi:hypothetical protein
MTWTVIWRDIFGEEKRTKTPSLPSALIQANHDRSRGIEVLGIEAPNGKVVSADDIEDICGAFFDAA